MAPGPREEQGCAVSGTASSSIVEISTAHGKAEKLVPKYCQRTRADRSDEGFSG